MFAALVTILALAPGASVLNDVHPAAQHRVRRVLRPETDGAPTTEWRKTLASVYSVGVTPVQDTLMWVSAGQSEMKVYIYNIRDPARPLIDSFAQTGGPSGWGIRDMAWKAPTNEVFAGFDNRTFHVYDATTHIPNHTYMVSGYSGTVRGFGYCPVQDSCWTCDFDLAPMTKFSVNGENGHEVRPASRMASAYGIAFDARQHCFWITQAAAAGASPTLKMDYDYNVVDSFNTEGWNQGGGCETWRDTFLLQLNQSTPDEVFCMRFALSPLLDHNVGVSAILSPSASINPGTITPKARVLNHGANSEANIPVTCWVDSAGVRLYSATATLSGPLAPGFKADVVFAPNWYSGPVGAQYNVTMFTALSGDENVHDDTSAGMTEVVGALFSDTIHVRPAGAAVPTVDGSMDAGEWTASNAYDVSDLAGRGGTPQSLGTCIAYCLYDSSFFYLALDCPHRTNRVSMDQFGPYIDEDGSGNWATDSSEGCYTIEYSDTGDQVLYFAMLDTLGNWYEAGPVPGAISASSLASGHLQFEARLPIGAYRYQLAIGSGDTVGCFVYVAFDGLSEYVGWWPQSITVSQWSNPRYYGTMILDTVAPGTSEREQVVPFALYRVGPSLVRNQADITYYVGKRTDVRLAVYDAAGSLVRTLVSGPVVPGERTVTWNRTDDSGRRVACGAYFCRLDVGGRRATSKAIVLNR